MVQANAYILSPNCSVDNIDWYASVSAVQFEHCAVISLQAMQTELLHQELCKS